MTRPFPLTAVRRTAGLVRRAATRLGTRGDRGQATAEYGLIILAAGGIALDAAFRESVSPFAGLFVLATAVAGVVLMRESRRIGRLAFPTRPRRADR